MAYGKRPFAVAAAGAATVVTGAGGLFGITIREATAVAAAATAVLYDNTSAAGTVLATVRLAADGEQQLWWSKGVKFGTGLHLTATGGDITGSLIVGSAGALRAIPFAGADLLLYTGPASLDSVVAAETAGAVAEWRMFDATSITGTQFVGAAPVANETVKLDWPAGITISNGLFYDQVAGAVSGNVYIY